MVDEIGRAVDHAPCTARRAEPSFATAEGHDVLVSAGRALDAQEPCFEPATTKIVVELPAHESRQARPLLAQVVEEGAGVLLEHLVEHGVLRSVADVAALASGPRARAMLPVASCVGIHARHCSPSVPVAKRVTGASRCRRCPCPVSAYGSPIVPRAPIQGREQSLRPLDFIARLGRTRSGARPGAARLGWPGDALDALADLARRVHPHRRSLAALEQARHAVKAACDAAGLHFLSAWNDPLLDEEARLSFLFDWGVGIIAGATESMKARGLEMRPRE